MVLNVHRNHKADWGRANHVVALSDVYMITNWRKCLMKLILEIFCCQGSVLFFVWIPGHVGIRHNSAAGLVAKNASMAYLE